MASFKDWTTDLPTNLDVIATNQPDCIDDPSATPNDNPVTEGDNIRTSVVHTNRDIGQYCAYQMGSDSKEAGTLRDILDKTSTEALWLRLYKRAADPTAVADKAFVYSKDDGGTVKVYVRWSDGTIKEVGAGGGGGQTDTVVGSNGITNTGDNVDAVITPTYGSSSDTICQGNDSRLSDSRPPTGSAGGDLTGSTYPNPVIAATAVGNTKLANMAQATIKGRASGAGTGDPVDLTAAQATAILNAFTDSLKGLVPSSGGGTSNFLRADGSWAAPSGAGAFDDNTYYPEYYESGLMLRTASIISSGVKLLFTRTGVMNGVRFRTIDTASTTFRAKLWNNTTEVASGTLATSAAGVYDITFTSPYTITSSMLGDTFYISLLDIVNGYTTYHTSDPPGNIKSIGICWAAIDGIPRSYKDSDDSAAPTGDASSSRFPVGPIYEVTL